MLLIDMFVVHIMIGKRDPMSRLNFISHTTVVKEESTLPKSLRGVTKI